MYYYVFLKFLYEVFNAKVDILFNFYRGFFLSAAWTGFFVVVCVGGWLVCRVAIACCFWRCLLACFVLACCCACVASCVRVVVLLSHQVPASLLCVVFILSKQASKHIMCGARRERALWFVVADRCAFRRCCGCVRGDACGMSMVVVNA